MNVLNQGPVGPRPIPVTTPSLTPGAPLGAHLPPQRISFRSLLREDPKRPAPAPATSAKGPAEHGSTPKAPAPTHGPAPTGLGSREPERDAAARLALKDDADDPLHPYHRHRAALAPPETLAPVAVGQAAVHPGLAPAVPVEQAAQATASRTASSLEDLLPALVRRVAWSGDGKRGTVRMELGAGALSGATLLVHADDGRVRVQLDLPPGSDAAEWKERITSRLASRGIPTDGVEVNG